MRKFLVLTVGLMCLTASPQLAAAKQATCSNRHKSCLDTVDYMISRGDMRWIGKQKSCDMNFIQCLDDGSWDGGRRGEFKRETGPGKPTITIMTGPNSGGGRNPGAPALGAWVNGTLNGGASSKTAPVASTGAATGAALNTQATGLTGIDKSVATPSALQDHLSRKQR